MEDAMERLFKELLRIIVAIGIASAAGVSPAADAGRWTYAGATGPAKWSTLEKSFALCKQGTTQSPIDIPDAEARKGDLASLLFNYKPTPLKIIDDGHTIQVNYAPGSFLIVGGSQYELVEFRFHRPGEEKISGKAHDMEADLVHRDKDGKVAIVAVLLDEGKENALIKTLWSNLPQDKGKEHVLDAVKINALGLLPQKKDYYTFAGSLTTPPCTENVTWFVLKNPTQVSADQIARFAKVYPMNARPIQPLNSRDIQGTR
ncbi:MAG: carbonic anhydrase family protein [Betaproteobacteria bacterium]|nr:MAG: carbonic anhydrase family protein [Betaproteobacteria bacterium]